MTTIIGTVKGLREMYYERRVQKMARNYVQMRELLTAYGLDVPDDV